MPMYFDKPLRDPTTGLNIPNAGCVTLEPGPGPRLRPLPQPRVLRGRRRWLQSTARGDLGRISRQQAFIRRAIQRAIDKGVRNPITLNSLVNVGIDTVSAVDTELTRRRPHHPRHAPSAPSSPSELQTMTLDVYDDNVNGAGHPPAAGHRGQPGAARHLQGPRRRRRRRGRLGAGRRSTTAPAPPARPPRWPTSFAALGFDTSPGTGDAERFDFAAHRGPLRARQRGRSAQYVAAQLDGGADLEEVGATYIADVIVVTGADYAGRHGHELQPPPTPLGAPAATGAARQPDPTAHDDPADRRHHHVPVRRGAAAHPPTRSAGRPCPRSLSSAPATSA